ncbi:MAG: SRPBCC domain-containing protein [Pseudomonadota bacterium]
MTTSAAPVFEIVRVLKQPLVKVWKAWSDAEQLQHWWGPQGCTVEIGRFEFRPGGFCHYAMRFPDAPAMWGRFNYRQIEASQKLVWLNSFANEQCGITRAPFSDDCPLEILNSVTFNEQHGVTTITLRAEPFGALPQELQFFEDLRPSLEQGYGGTLEQLTEFLAKVSG